jgi:hypothetical protein
LTALTGAGTDIAADSLPIYDNDAAAEKKILATQLAIALNATQAQQETGTATGALVSPAVQQFHPSAAKGWVEIDAAAGNTASYNVTSIGDNGAGDYTITWATDFSAAAYCAVATAQLDTDIYARITTASHTAGVTRVQCRTVAATPAGADPDHAMVAVFGDQ